ncbi:MAG: hypothetical protein BWK76_21855 [Desulfobulbaceae bacterium A2]|nr:MAG: hypothetical protein BWK76_21855 [Desulfobulbaceae bacterium A2]
MGGQAVQASDLLQRFRREGYDVGFLPVNPKYPGILGLLQRIKYVRTLLTWPAYLISLLARIPRYDVLHLFSASYLSFLLAPAPAAIIGKLFGKRVVLNYHSGEAEDHLQRSSAAVKSILKFVDCVVVPSQYLQQIFDRFGIETTAIPNVVEMEAFRFRQRKTFQPRLLVSRTLEPIYNITCILKAFRFIQDSIPAASLTILGSGSQELALRALADELSLQQVSFAGRIERRDIPRYYADHDIMLNASNIDNLPLSIIEAFAAGMPVVSTEAGGIPFIIRNRETGMLVPLNDCRRLADSTLELLEHQELAHAIASAAYTECSKLYTWPSVRAKWLQVYESCH